MQTGDPLFGTSGSYKARHMIEFFTDADEYGVRHPSDYTSAKSENENASLLLQILESKPITIYMEETSAQPRLFYSQLFDCWEADTWLSRVRCLYDLAEGFYILSYLFLSLDTQSIYMVIWLTSRALSRLITEYTTDDTTFLEANGLSSPMSYLRVIFYDD